ncbi:Ankyrin-3 [Colletotrichum tanaceti]|uniref:Ankyrin-3 n=1 Tax=Colletotrichum tanaceti TaxID=1306861 RepID=A0A4U6XQG1_9PEZI|nr:Ankyrin-3 [Colletotrichum tanaceti]TKW57889.1 Ankyrin-3 [Colletotrichum tanaceti]
MDPLSISASIIALFQVPVALGKGAQLLATLRHAPADFCDLVNELSTLQAVIKQVKSSLEELTSEQTSNMAPTPVDTSAAVALELSSQSIDDKVTILDGQIHAKASDLEQLSTAKFQPPYHGNLLKLDRPNVEADPYVSVEASMVSVVYNCDIAWIKRGIANSTVLPTDVDDDGNSLLMLSLRDVNLTLSEFLVQQGWPLHLENVTGWTASSRSRLLYYATKHKRIQYLKPEHRLIGATSVSVSDAITQARSDIDSLDSYGWCPLHWAIYLDDYNSLEVLLYRGASPKTVTRSGWTPLHYAARYEPPGSVKMALAIIAAGADINAQVRNYRGLKGETAIIFAFDNPDMIKLLLEHSSDIVVKTDIDWVCPLSYRARRTSNVDRRDPRRWYWNRSLDLLSSAGMGLDLPSQQTGYEGRTPLHDTILWRNAALLELLIQHGARLDAMDKYGSGVLHFAAQSANLELINVLRDAQLCGLNPDQTNAAGDTPMKIMTARMYGAEERRQPGETRPTYAEWLAFKQLLLEIRGRNCGHFSTDHTSIVSLGRHSHSVQSEVEDITSMGGSEDNRSDEDESLDTSEGLRIQS